MDVKCGGRGVNWIHMNDDDDDDDDDDNNDKINLLKIKSNARIC
jgi:hypothetical protein